MHTPLARSNEADYPRKDIWELQAKITPDLVMEMCEQFGMVGCYEKISLGIAKTLWRYQSAALHALEQTPPAQTKELSQLKKAIERALGAFEAITAENKSQIDHEIMYRDPFNPKFFFKEQLDYWGKKRELYTNRHKQT